MIELYGLIRDSGQQAEFDDNSNLTFEFVNLKAVKSKLKTGKKASLAKKRLTVLAPFEIGLICRNESLQQVSLANNRLAQCPGALFAYNGIGARLLKVDLSSNQLTSLPPQISHLKSCVCFNASKNFLKELPYQIEQMQKLETLDLSFNHLEAVPKVLGTVTSLKKLILNNNKCRSIPYALGKLKNVKQLAIYDNPLGDPPNSVVIGGAASILPYLKKKYDDHRTKERYKRATQSVSKSSFGESLC